MGLDTSHDCWHGPYSSFSRWRNAVAVAGGYTLEEANYDGVRYLQPKEIDWSSLTEKNFMGKWEKWPDDPLVILLAHSDCEGKIPREHCLALAVRLEALLPNLPKGDGGDIDYWRDKTRQFITGLRQAAELGEDVDFH